MIKRIVSMAAALGVALAGMVAVSAPANAHHEINWPGYGKLRYVSDWVDVADRTQAFPVTTAVANWDVGLNTVNLTYKWWDCATADPCVMVWEAWLPGAPGYIVFGDMAPQFGGANGFRGANVRLNPTSANTAAQRQKTATHEVGHALGLGEHPGCCGFDGSVMLQGWAPPISLYPDWHDFQAANDLHAP